MILLDCHGGAPNSGIAQTPLQVASQGLASLEKFDSASVSSLLSPRESEKTGLSSAAAKAVIDGPFMQATKYFRPVGEPKITDLDTGSVEIQRSYLSIDGSHHVLSLIATAESDGARLTPLSMELLTALGNAERKPGEYYLTAWRRVIKNNRAFFNSVGWHGIYGTSSLEDYRDWDALDKHLAEIEQKHMSAKAKV
jgi:hypothetical protein